MPEMSGDNNDFSPPTSPVYESADSAWINIQLSTFSNWINEKLSKVGVNEVTDLAQDLSDGVKLVRLVEVLTAQNLGKICLKPSNQHQRLANVDVAMRALVADNLRLVNIGSQDIVNQNLKLIMGLVWSLILKYQISKAGGSTSGRAPPKKLMMAWLRSVLPGSRINNFSSDWNDGRYLLGVLDYCKPGLCPIWSDIDSKEGLANCRRGLRLGEDIFQVPPIVSAEDMNNPNLDELSCMTYLSYFMNEGSPGYQATLDWVNTKLPDDRKVTNFTSDFRDGNSLCDLVHAVGGDVRGYPQDMASANSLDRAQRAITGGEGLSVPPILSAKDLLRHDLDHITVMAYCAALQKAERERPKKKVTPSNHAPIHNTSNGQHVEEPAISLRHYDKQESQMSTSSGRQSHHSDSNDQFASMDLRSPNSSLDFRHKTETSEWAANKVEIWLDNDPVLHSECCLFAEIPSPAGKRIPSDWKLTSTVTLVDSEGIPLRTMKSKVEDDKSSTVEGRRVILFTPDTPGQYKVETHLDGFPIGQSPYFLKVAHLPISPRPTVEPSTSFFEEQVTVENVSVVNSQPASDTSPTINQSESTMTSVDMRMMNNSVRVGEECVFIANLSALKEQVRDINVKVTQGYRPINVEVTSPDQYDQSRVTFVPDKPGEYNVEAYLGSHEILGSPFFLNVSDVAPPNPGTSSRHEEANIFCSGDCLSHGKAPINNTSQFRVKGLAIQPSQVQVTVKRRDSSKQLNALVRGGSPDEVTVDFHPKELGPHIIEVFFKSASVPHSPFTVMVFDPKDIKVKLQKEVLVGKETHIVVDHGDAGPIEITVSAPSHHHPSSSHSPVVNGGSRNVPIHQVSHTPSSQTFAYTPHQPGDYQIFVRTVAGRLAVPGCPAIQHVVSPKSDQGHKRHSKGSMEAFGDGLVRGCVGESAAFTVDPKGQKGDLFVEVDGPTSIAHCDIAPDPKDPGLYTVHYVPKEPGEYTIKMLWNDTNIPGSPFLAKVVAPKSIVCISDEGLFLGHRLSLRVNEVKEVIFDTRSAGPGALTAWVGGPRQGEEVHCTAMPTGMPHQWLMKFTPVHEGEHRIRLNWEGFLLPGAPYYAVALAPFAGVDHNKVILSGRGLREAFVMEEAEFIIDGRQAGPGEPLVQLSSVRATDARVNVTPLTGDRYRCSYTPLIPGAYLLTIYWSDLQVRGSPFKVNVLSQSDYGKVECRGEGLSRGVIGRDIRCQIDTRRAGPGELTAQCIGPTKVAYCELSDHRDGTFTLKLNPQEPGKHVLTIQFNSHHVPGSPFSLRVSGSPDASKVTVTGPGIEPGVLSTFQSRFICETRGAGAGQLTVRIKGRQGAFRVQMERENQSDRTIVCRFDPTEAGEYIIHIKWSGVHVKGSPFKVDIFDSIRELSNYFKQNPEMVPDSMKDGNWKSSI